MKFQEMIEKLQPGDEYKLESWSSWEKLEGNGWIFFECAVNLAQFSSDKWLIKQKETYCKETTVIVTDKMEPGHCEYIKCDKSTTTHKVIKI